MPRSRTRRAEKDAAPKPEQVRVAIYTRKSTEKGLDQEFTSLENQRQAIEGFIASRRCEGWIALPDVYEDAGISGATTARPAFQRLLQDIQDGKVDVVAVHKYDRISRSQLDFLRIIEFFDEHSVSFVSVTQAFDTSTNIGRLMLNMLGGFAEFERRMISERTKEKIRASRAKGLWTGGRPVLGLDVVDKALVVNETEAHQVREIFRLYLELGSLLAVVQEVGRRGWTNKTLLARTTGRTHTGKPFNKQTIRFLLTNPLYAGKVRCNGDLHCGVHEAIVDPATWQRVQEQLDAHTNQKGYVPRRSGSFLSGLLYCGVCGMAMSPTYTYRRQRRYRFYTCLSAQKKGAAACPKSRVPAADIESFVIDKVKEIGGDAKLVKEVAAAAKKQLNARMPGLAREVKRLEADQRTLSRERNNLVDAIGKNGNGSASLAARLGEVDAAIEKVVADLAAARAQIAALEHEAIDEKDLKAALASFVPVWDQLFPAERSRLLHLLIERVVYNAADGELAITFRPGGVRALADENEGAAA